MWQEGVKCDMRTAGNTLRGTGGWVCGCYNEKDTGIGQEGEDMNRTNTQNTDCHRYPLRNTLE